MNKDKWKSRFHEAAEAARKVDRAATMYSNTHDPAAVLVGHPTRQVMVPRKKRKGFDILSI